MLVGTSMEFSFGEVPLRKHFARQNAGTTWLCMCVYVYNFKQRVKDKEGKQEGKPFFLEEMKQWTGRWCLRTQNQIIMNAE